MALLQCRNRPKELQSNKTKSWKRKELQWRFWIPTLENCSCFIYFCQMVPSLCCGSLGLWLYLIKRQNKKCLKAKMINYHCFKIKLNHYLSAGPPLSIVPCRTKCWQTAFAFPSSCLTTTFHSLFKGIFLKSTMQQTSLTILVRKIKVLISDFSDLVTNFG